MKNFSEPAFRVGNEAGLTALLTVLKLSRVGTAGTVPATNCACLKVLASTVDRVREAIPPFTNSSVDIEFTDLRTFSLFNADSTFE